MGVVGIWLVKWRIGREGLSKGERMEMKRGKAQALGKEEGNTYF